MKPSVPVTLQINLAPGDWPLARFVLPHQIKIWRGQVDEILLTIDLNRSAGRFASGWEEGLERILPLARSMEGVRVETIDYGEESQARVAKEFFHGSRVPAKDFRGGPCYAYFFGLAAATHDHVLHSDADMFFGGGSQHWLAEAVEYMASHPEILVTAPLPGPPSPDGGLRHLLSSRDKEAPHAHHLEEMSTRLFLLDRTRFRKAVGGLVSRPPPRWRNRIKAWVEGNPCADLPEHLFTTEMKARGLVRRDFLGSTPGMWSLHPPYRCADFFAKLPELVRRIEAGDIPDAQRGDHDINGSLVDWSEALESLDRNRWWRRLYAKCKR